jgi:hypothetical protein
MPPKRHRPQAPTFGPKPAAECVTLDALAGRARLLDALDDRLRHLLPAAVARETRLADIRAGRIIFLASSPIWASRIRLYQSALLAEARIALGDAIERFTVKVTPLPTVPPEPAKPKPLSTTAIHHLQTAAETCRDPELRALYLNLASVATEDPPH